MSCRRGLGSRKRRSRDSWRSMREGRGRKRCRLNRIRLGWNK